MENACAACTKGPSGIDGHQDLLVQMMGNAVMTFKCRSCAAVWSRSYRGEGELVWTRVDPSAPVDPRKAATGSTVP